jgi:glycosyltransferase involved in cell wall biosynthesis
VVATVHDVIPLSYYGNDLPARLRVFYRWNLRRAVRANAVITVSEDSRRQIAALAHVDRKRIAVIPNAVDFEPNPDAAAVASLGVAGPYVLYTGSYEPRKNLAGALRAFRGLIDRGYPHQLAALVERESGHAARAHRLLAELGLESRVRLLDSLDKRDLRALYTLADCVLFPSFAEGFGLPLVQAQACGTPVVASDLAVLHEVGGEAAEYVDPTDPAEITGTLARVLDRGRSGARPAAGLPARYGVDHLVRAHVETYARLVRRPAPALVNIA